MTITFVAEIGVNHNGSLDEALWLIDQAKKSGADIAKLQLWEGKPELSHLQLSREQIGVCSDYCYAHDIEFMCTPFDVASLWWLVDKMQVRRIKLSSSAVFDKDLLQQAGRTRLPIILSTGMSNEGDIEAALRCLRFAPSITLMHCVSGYPTPLDQANLRAINSLRTYAVPLGYSDHTGDPLAIWVAIALGATMIEMHITRSRIQEGPDHSSSYYPESFAVTVDTAKSVESMLGDGQIVPQECAMSLRSKLA